MNIKKTNITCNITETFLIPNQVILNHIDKLSFKKEEMYSSFFFEDEALKKTFIDSYKDWLINFFKKDLNKDFDKMGLMNIWCQKYTNNSRHPLHVHHENNTYVSFIWYINCTDKSSDTMFYNPGYPHCNYFEKAIKPEKNKIVFFDAFIPHEVLQNEDEARCVLSGNFKLINERI